MVYTFESQQYGPIAKINQTHGDSAWFSVKAVLSYQAITYEKPANSVCLFWGLLSDLKAKRPSTAVEQVTLNRQVLASGVGISSREGSVEI